MHAGPGSPHIALLATFQAPAFLSEYYGKSMVLVSRGVTCPDFKRPFCLSTTVVTIEALKDGSIGSRKKAPTDTGETQ